MTLLVPHHPMDHNGVLHLCLCRNPPHGLGKVVQDVVELALKNSVEPLIPAHSLELAAVDGLAIHHNILFQLLPDAFEPLALRCGPGLADQNGLQRRVLVIKNIVFGEGGVAHERFVVLREEREIR